MTAMDPSDSFLRLQPVCVKISKEPTQKNVKDLAEMLVEVQADHLRELFNYTIFPLKLAMQYPNSSNELKQAAVECAEKLIARTGIDDLHRFEDIFTMLLMLLSAKDEQLRYKADLSEELKLAVISCLTCVLDSTAVVLKASLYSTKFLPVLGHAVWLLLALAEHEKARSVQVNSLNCLRKLAFCAEAVKGGSYKEDNDAIVELTAGVQSSAAVCFASFLPGISTKLCKLITGDSKQGHNVLTAGLDLWGDVISLVMKDQHLPDQPSSDEGMISQLSGLFLQSDNHVAEKSGPSYSKNAEAFVSDARTVQTKVNGLRVQITPAWQVDTAGKLKILLERLEMVVSHSSLKVRLCLAEFANKLLSSCAISIQPSVPVLVDLLVGLTRDDFPQVTSRSKSILREFSCKKIQSASTSLRSLCEENLHALLTSLPQLIMRTADDGKKLQTVNLVVGYLSLLGKSVGILLNSAAHLKRLSLALMQVLELDLSDVGIVEEKTSSISETAVLPSDTKGENPLSFPAAQFLASKYPKYRFKHFTDERIYTALSELCCLLGYYGNLPLLVDHFVDLFQKSRTQQKQAVFVLNHIVKGYLGQGVDEATGVFRDADTRTIELDGTMELLLTEYTADCNLNRPTANQSKLLPSSEKANTPDLTIIRKERSVNGFSFEVLNSNIQLSCLLLEGIGILALVPGNKFEPFLINTIYPVMSKLGDDNATVSRSAYGTLLQICQSSGHVSIDELIAANADYLVNAISLNLKYVFVNQQAPRVLQVMIQYSNASILSIIEDTLTDIFTVIDIYPDQLMYSLIKVLKVLICSVKRWFPVSVKTEGTKTTSTCTVPEAELDVPGGKERASPEDIRRFFLDYHKRKQMALGEVDSEELSHKNTEGVQEGGEVEDEDASFETDQASEIPLHVKYVTQVLEKCIHFLPAKSAWLRLLVLDTVQNGVLVLHDAENQLLPMIHRLWPAIVRRFTDKEQVVTVKAVKVLCTMAEASGDFMRRRVLKDVLPLLTAFLDKQALTSIKAGPAYSHTHACHLQEAMLIGLGCLCRQLEISEIDLNHAVCTCAPYLSCRQPKQLQQAAVQTFEKFILLEPDHMWLTLNDLYCPRQPSPPHPLFKAIKLGGLGPENEYSENVKMLLEKL